MRENAKKISKDTIKFSAKEFLKKCLGGAGDANVPEQSESSTVIGGGNGRVLQTPDSRQAVVVVPGDGGSNGQNNTMQQTSVGTPIGFVAIKAIKDSGHSEFYNNLSPNSKTNIGKLLKKEAEIGYSLNISGSDIEIVKYIDNNYLHKLNEDSSPAFKNSGPKYNLSLARDIDVLTEDGKPRKMDISFVHSINAEVESNNIYIKFKKDDANKLRKAIIAIPVKSPIFKISEMSYSNK